MVKCSNIDFGMGSPDVFSVDSGMGSPDLFSVLILIQEWAHLMVQCPNIDSGMGSPDGSVS